MKPLSLILFSIVVVYHAHAQTRPMPHEWSATLRVVDEFGAPVPGALTWVSYSVPTENDDSKGHEQIRGMSDTNGLFQASHTDQSIALGFHAEKEGYYPTSIQHFLGFESDSKSVNWNPTQTMELVKIGKPIPMFAKRAEAKLLKEAEPLGFDLTAGDWVKPLGAGTNADMLFTAARDVKSAADYTAELRLTFPNNGDGIRVIPPLPTADTSSWLIRTAPETGYDPDRTWRVSAGSRPESVRGYYFRVRTVLDAEGKVKSALYGKITGDVRLFVGTKAPHAGISFDYYLNPTPNDRNLEFDPRRNLLPGARNVQP
jgi:hypothetical protein